MMGNALLIMAYPHDGEVLTQFYFGVSQESVRPYEGDARLVR